MNSRSLWFIFLSITIIFLNCTSTEPFPNEPVGTALIDGVTKDGNKYNVNVWQAPDPNRGKVVTSLSPNTALKIYSIEIVDEIPWFTIKTEKGQKGSLTILHLKNIKVKSDYLAKFNIDYARIQTLSMMPDDVLNRKKIESVTTISSNE